MNTPEHLLAADDSPPVTVHNEAGHSPFLIVADHAGNLMPRALDRLGVSECECERHVAWDIGIAGVSRLMAEALDATLVQQNYSRLVIDCNRRPGSETSISEISELTAIPGDIGLSENRKAARVREIFRPYHDRIEAELDRRRAERRPSALIAMHSFTPVFKGVERPWHAGVLYNRDPRFAQILITLLQREAGLVIGDNEPYSVTDASDYTIPVHGEQRGLLHVAIEVRQDRIIEDAGQRAWSALLARLLSRAWRRVGPGWNNSFARVPPSFTQRRSVDLRRSCPVQTRRRPIKVAKLQTRPFRVKAANLSRRRFLHLAAGTAALPAVSRNASAQAYPTRPITMIVSFTAGSGSDLIGRIIAERMRETLGQPIIIENVGGADGSIGAGRTARAKPDGYTIDVGSIGNHVLNGAFYSLNYDLLDDFAPISPLTTTSFFLYAKKTMPARDLTELIAWLKSNPKVSAGSSAVGPRLVTAVFQRETGTRLAVVPYRGNNAVFQDLMGGQIDITFNPPDGLPLLRAGSLKAYAATSNTRLTAAPDIPTFAEQGFPKVSWSTWFGLFAPKGTPKDIIGKLNAAAVEALADPAVRSRLTDLGGEVFPREQQTPEALGALVKADAEKWWPIIKEVGIKAQ